MNKIVSLPERAAYRTTQIMNKYEKKCIILFLLGVISSKTSLNYKYRKIFIQFPCTKSPLAYKLKELFGGSVYSKYYKSSEYTCYELKSKEDLRNLKKVVVSLSNTIPSDYLDNLSQFLNEVVR